MYTPSETTHSLTPRAYRVADFCRAFGLSRSSVYKLMGEGQLTTVKVGGRRLIPAEAAEALLKAEG
jgi:excisionase family DNA binding protein